MTPILEDNYEPFGKEWEAEIMKMNKPFIIGLYRKQCLKRQETETQLEEAKKEIERLKRLIDELWELKFYATAPLSPHAGVMSEMYKRAKQQFKTDNNI